MAPTELLAASAGAVLVPTLMSPVLDKVPGGRVGLIVAGVAMIWGGTKLKEGGVIKGLIVGAGAGVVVSQIAAMVIGNKQRATA